MTTTPVADASSATSATTPAAPTQPIIDIAKITADAVSQATAKAEKIADEKATKVAAQKLEMIGKALTGDKGADMNEVILKTFVADPLKAFHTVKEAAKKEALDQVRSDNQIADLQRAVASPFLSEYPELNSPNKLALVERLADQYEASGTSYADALKKGFEETVKEFGLKSVSEAHRTGAAYNTGLPGGGGFIPGAPQHDEAKSQSNFMTNMKNKMNSFRVKK